MHQEPFVAEILEQIFSLGLHVPHAQSVLQYLERTCDGDATPNPSDFTEECVDEFDLTSESNPLWGTISRTAGAAHKWLAVHEAGHAIVGLNVPLPLTGIRFNRDGSKGLAILHDPDWRDSTDEELLRRLIRVDVAGNMAQLLCPNCHPPEGCLSSLYDDRTSGNRPTDFIDADEKAKRLAVVLLEQTGKPLVTEEIWHARRAIVERAEVEATQILQENLKILELLACELLNGPMTGTAVNRVVETAAKS